METRISHELTRTATESARIQTCAPGRPAASANRGLQIEAGLQGKKFSASRRPGAGPRSWYGIRRDGQLEGQEERRQQCSMIQARRRLLARENKAARGGGAEHALSWRAAVRAGNPFRPRRRRVLTGRVREEAPILAVATSSVEQQALRHQQVRRNGEASQDSKDCFVHGLNFSLLCRLP